MPHAKAARPTVERRRMPIQTLFLDAGGVVVFPNWVRVSDALARHGVRADPSALAEAEPHIKRQVDVAHTIAKTNDNRLGWLYFDLILERRRGLAGPLVVVTVVATEIDVRPSMPIVIGTGAFS